MKMLDYATPRQKHTIALLCNLLRISYPIEEREMTKGEAGTYIRRLRNLLRNKDRSG